MQLQLQLQFQRYAIELRNTTLRPVNDVTEGSTQEAHMGAS